MSDTTTEPVIDGSPMLSFDGVITPGTDPDFVFGSEMVATVRLRVDGVNITRDWSGDGARRLYRLAVVEVLGGDLVAIDARTGAVAVTAGPTGRLRRAWRWLGAVSMVAAVPMAGFVAAFALGAVAASLVGKIG
jgi:hypothetical protein